MDSGQIDRAHATANNDGAKVRSHRDLVVWQKAMDLVDLVYDILAKFPASENFALIPQMKRAVVSVPANIAEGQSRSTARDFAHFLSVAKSSLMETETLLMVAARRGYALEADAQPAFSLIVEISKMLVSLRRRLLSKRGGN